MNNKDLCQCNQGRLPCTCKGGEPKAQYTAVDMATAAAEGFRDGAKSVVVELPSADCINPTPRLTFNMGAYRAECKAAIIAAGGSVKE